MATFKLNPLVKGDHISIVDGKPVNLGGRDLTRTKVVDGVESEYQIPAATQADLKKIHEQGATMANRQHLVIKVDTKSTATSSNNKGDAKSGK